MKIMRGLFLITIGTLLYLTNSIAQPVPAQDENIPYLMTFGPSAETSWGDDDFSQTFFFLIPEDFKDPVFIKVWDPDVGGKNDEQNEAFNTRVTYSVYGGKECYTHEDAQTTDPVGNYKSGNLLGKKSFSEHPRYDNNWYTFGPFNPSEGEYVKKFQGHIFKVICDGVSGDDGNVYRYYLSTDAKENKPVEGGNAFAYEYSFRMWDDPTEVSHIYPYVDDKTFSVRQANFDWDSDGFIRVVSVARKGQFIKASADDEWVESEFKILEEEKNSSLDFQFIKKKGVPVKNNNVVIYVKNQYGELLPFYTIPIGGVPKYKYSIGVKPQPK
jgi:hypothetical protein